MENIIKHWHAGTRIVSKGAYFQGNNVKIGENVIFLSALEIWSKECLDYKKKFKTKMDMWHSIFDICALCGSHKAKNSLWAVAEMHEFNKVRKKAEFISQQTLHMLKSC